jgi:phosphonate dehydrogenase
MLPTVVITNWVHEGALERLKRIAKIIANPEKQPWPAPVLESHLRKADAVVTFMPDRINEEDLRKFPRLKLIACALKGYDNFDITACTRRGITVTIVEDLLTIPSAELAIGLMIGLGRHLLQGDTVVREGKFHGWRPWFYGLGMHGSTVGLIGLGAIGQAIAERLLAFGSNQIYYDSRKAPSDLEQKLRLRLVPFEELLSQSDFVRDKTLLTPHLGSAVDGFRRQIAEQAIENVIEFLEGRRPPGAINAPE